MISERFPIRATSHIINLLGDELIGSDSLAIFELVKNSYDADATKVTIYFNDLDNSNRNIVIEDNGSGMTPQIIQNVWLTIGTDYKKKKAKISPIFHRSSLGNKGVGRLAVHRLADEITLESQARGEIFGSRLHINWSELIKSEEYIEDLSVVVEDGVTDLFETGHGTRIILTGLKTKKWTKVILKDLAQKIMNIKNPFEDIDSFEIEIICNEAEKQEWIDEAKNPLWVLDRSLYSFRFLIEPSSESNNGLFKWSYKFNPINISSKGSIKPREIRKIENSFLLKPISTKDNTHNLLTNQDLEKIGPISGVFHVFNQNGKIIDHAFGAGKRVAVKSFIKDNCGVKIFRDNIRVYNYGEPSDDWLGLELAKVQRAGDHFSKKVTIGAVFLNLLQSESGLKEKTNREGFTDNDTYRLFVSIIQEVFSFFEREASADRDLIEAFTSDTPIVKKVGLSDTIKELDLKLSKKGLSNEFQPLLRKVEKDYNEMRDLMLNSGMNGLNLSLVFHEVEREIRFINLSLEEANYDKSILKQRIKSLFHLIENFAPIVKQSRKIRTTASKLIERALEIHKSRFNYHNIVVSSPILTKEAEDFELKGPGNLLLSSLSNIIDNAIYWVDVQSEITASLHLPKAIYISSDVKSFDGPAIIIADNGTGFNLDTDSLVQPYRTLKPGGMGLGLYFVNLVMETIGGKLLFPSMGDCDTPTAYSGAIIALIFPKDLL
ncbi:ATP-binding protein [uncultured Duncaniella sp.]|uniref:ATP-binding protein n=1 Tax=uncultured Duncaniella sp. TaxID=2768039 RepID=UPI0026764D24|nr:ATP-binding protein [uncultured Duncaniella sp.]